MGQYLPKSITYSIKEHASLQNQLFQTMVDE